MALVVEQLGLATINPGQLLLACWVGIKLVWSGLTSGMSKGTSGVMRKEEALVTTA